MIILLLIAILFVVAYSLAHHWLSARMQGFLIPLLIASILYILGYVAGILITPLQSASKLVAVAFIAVIVLYGARRLWSRADGRRNP